MKRFDVSCMKVDFNQEMICSVVSPDSSTIKATALFRTVGDLAGLIYHTSEPGQHSAAAYPLNRDYTDTVLSFDLDVIGDGVDFSSLLHKPALAITSGSMEYYVTLGFLGVGISDSDSFVWDGDKDLSHHWIKWDSETVTYTRERLDTDPPDLPEVEPGIVSLTASRGTDYAMDYANGILRPVEDSNIPYMADIEVTYQYCSDHRYEIDFGSLYEGEHPDISSYVPTYAIDKIMFPLLPEGYTGGDRVYTGSSDKVVFLFSNWTIQGGEIGNPGAALPVNHCQFAEGYDDEYYQNPQRIIDVMYHLGYRGSVDLYIGASHYYDFYGTEDETGLENQHMITGAAKGINAAFEEWLTYFARAAHNKGFTEIVLSISMESLHIPDSWRQKMFDGNPGQSGWAPPTSFYSPTNPEVRAWYGKVCRNILNIVVGEGLPAVLQLGEPWWWWQEFVPGDVSRPYANRPPCFYDDYTVQKYQSEFGVPMPRFISSSIDDEEYEATLIWLREQLGEFSDYIRSIVKEYPNGKYLILFFPPSVLDTTRVPAAIRQVNVPFSHWKYPNLDRIQIEDYDWLIHENDRHSSVYHFAQDYFGYPGAQVDYYAGFAWNMYTIEDNFIINISHKEENPTQSITIKSVSTKKGSVNITPKNGCYIDVITSGSSPYNAIVLRSEQYHFADRIYVTNAGTHGMAIAYVNKAWNTPTLVGWVDPGKIIVLIYNGWTAANMWTWGVVARIQPNGILHSDEAEEDSNVIPISYQWGLIENASRWARSHHLPVYLWAGTQIRRDSYVPGRLYHSCTPYVEVGNAQIAQAAPRIEIAGETVPVTGVYVETGWHETNRYTRISHGT